MSVSKVEQHISNIALVVQCYDQAIEFYTQKLGFQLLEDTALGENKRWVRVAPPNSSGMGTSILLAKATSPQQLEAVGNQSGGRVFLFLHTNNFWRDYDAMNKKGVKFNESPREEEYGVVAVFEDLYGNKWDLLQLHKEQ